MDVAKCLAGVWDWSHVRAWREESKRLKGNMMFVVYKGGSATFRLLSRVDPKPVLVTVMLTSTMATVEKRLAYYHSDSDNESNILFRIEKNLDLIRSHPDTGTATRCRISAPARSY